MPKKSTVMNTSQTALHDSYHGKIQLQQLQNMSFLNHAMDRINLDASETNFRNSFLNEALSVYALLASVELEMYVDLFAQRNIELEQFLELTYLDLQLLGIEDNRHRNIIMELISAFRFD